MPIEKLYHPIVGDEVRNVAVAPWAQRHYFDAACASLNALRCTTPNGAKVGLK